MAMDSNGFPKKSNLGALNIKTIYNTNRTATAPCMPAVHIRPEGTEANIDLVLSPKGFGSIMLTPPDGTINNGNGRSSGTSAGSIDLQFSRTAATQVASGSSAFAAGLRNTSSGTGSIALGSTNTASNTSAIAMGTSNTASAANAVAMGNTNTANGSNSIATGSGSSTNGCPGRWAHNSGSNEGQFSHWSMKYQTSNATLQFLTYDGSSVGASSQVKLKAATAFYFEGWLAAKQLAPSTNHACWKIEGLIFMGSSADTTVLTWSAVTSKSNGPAWTDPVLTADTARGALAISVTGVAATVIEWHCYIITSEAQ